MPQRAIDTKYWTDPFIQKLPFAAKSLYIYLWTNEHCNQAGLYEITIETMAFETGLSEDEIVRLLKILEPKVAWYPETNLVWVKNFLRHQAKSTKFVVAAVNILQSMKIPDELMAEFELYNQDLLEGVAPSQHISLTKRECVAIRDGFVCQYCGSEIQDESDYEMDHIVPIARGGKDNYLNLVASCHNCNQRKFNKTPSEAGLPEPSPTSFHAAQALYLLKTNHTLLEKWLTGFPQRRKVASRIIGEQVNQYQSILFNIDQYQQRIFSNTTTTANTKSDSDRGLGVVKGEGINANQNLAEISKIYEENIGIITPIVADNLQDIASRYQASWFRDAVAEAVKNNVRKLSYVQSILDRWSVEGKGTARARDRPHRDKRLRSAQELKQAWKGEESDSDTS